MNSRGGALSGTTKEFAAVAEFSAHWSVSTKKDTCVCGLSMYVTCVSLRTVGRSDVGGEAGERGLGGGM